MNHLLATSDTPVLDRWLQRLSAAAMLALALSLLGVGLALYLPRSDSPAVSSPLSQKDSP